MFKSVKALTALMALSIVFSAGTVEAKRNGTVNSIKKIIADERGSLGLGLATVGSLFSIGSVRYAIGAENQATVANVFKSLVFYYGAPVCAAVAIYGGYLVRQSLVDEEASADKVA